MKKNLVLGAVFAAALFAVSPAKAIDSTGGCGLGSMAWRGQSGIIPQVLAMTTNGIFLNTIGVTLGTSGCDPNGRVTGGTGKLVLAVIENNMEQFAMDASAGRGETIDTIAGLWKSTAKNSVLEHSRILRICLRMKTLKLLI